MILDDRGALFWLRCLRDWLSWLAGWLAGWVVGWLGGWRAGWLADSAVWLAAAWLWRSKYPTSQMTKKVTERQILTGFP